MRKKIALDSRSLICDIIIMESIEIKIYASNNGKQPFLDWHNKLEKTTKAVINTRLGHLRRDNIGDCKKIKGADIWELRINYGPGYRIYFGRKDQTIVVLLIGGSKGSQSRDIIKAQNYWLEYKKVMKHG